VRGPVRVLALATLSCVSVWAAPQQRPTFRSTANGVLVNAFVVSSNGSSTKPIDGLTSADFLVTDNGTRQTVEVSRAAGPIDLTLVVDGGGDATPYAKAFRQAAVDLVTGLRPTDRVRLLVCAGLVREVAPMQSAAARLSLDAIGDRGAPYGPAIVHGLFDAMVREADPERRHVVVSLATFTGRDVFSPQALVSVATSSDAVVYVVVEPTGTPIFPDTFQALGRVVGTTGGILLLKADTSVRSGLPPSFYFSPRVRGASGGAAVATFKSLKQAVLAILADLAHGYVLSYSPPGGTAPGWHDLTVQVTRTGIPGLLVRARKRYFAASE
jgi:VWFA-related protein